MPQVDTRSRVRDLGRASAGWTVAIGGLFAFAFAGALAAQDNNRVGVSVGDADLYPALRIDYLTNDNVFVDADNIVEGTSVVVSPSAEFVADRRLLLFNASYTGEFAQGSEDVLDYADHVLGLTLDAEVDKRRRPGVFLEYRRGHQEVGFDMTRGRASGLTEPVMFDQFHLGGYFRYGVVDARGNVEGGITFTSRQYTNLDRLTDGRDYTVIRPYGLFSYRLSGDTRALLELRYATILIDNEVDDRGELSLFGGLEFTATGRIRGAARIGATQATYAGETREAVTLPAAIVDVSYLLREYATLRLRLERELDDSAVQIAGGGAAQAIRDNVRLGWSHEWTSRISHEAFMERSSVVQDCPSGDSNTLMAGLEINYGVRRWLSFGANVIGQSRNSETCADGDAGDSLDYDRRVLGVHVRATL